MAFFPDCYRGMMFIDRKPFQTIWPPSCFVVYLFEHNLWFLLCWDEGGGERSWSGVLFLGLGVSVDSNSRWDGECWKMMEDEQRREVFRPLKLPDSENINMNVKLNGKSLPPPVLYPPHPYYLLITQHTGPVDRNCSILLWKMSSHLNWLFRLNNGIIEFIVLEAKHTHTHTHWNSTQRNNVSDPLFATKKTQDVKKGG